MTNIAKILKNAPKGLKLYSSIFGKCTLLSVKKDEIEINKCEGNPPYYFYYLNNAGIDHPDGECVLFPSKEHKSWDNWQEVLFQRGDVIRATDGEILLFNSTDYAFTNKAESIIITKDIYRYATPEEHEQFFKELNMNGYKWNADTKQMEKIEQQYTPKYDCSGCKSTITKEEQFTIDDFKPFNKVLVRDTNSESWYCNLFSHFNKNASYGKYEGIYGNWMQCIPYNDETKHLLGTTDDAPNKYKTW